MGEDSGHDWLSLVSVSGLLVSEPVLQTHFPDGPESVGDWPARRLTTEWERFSLKGRKGQSQWLNFVLETLLEIPTSRWRKHPSIPSRTTHALAEYAQTLRPSRLLVDEADDPLLLVSIVPPKQGLDARETESGKWRASPATKLDRLMRAVEVPLGLLTNGRDFRLIYAEAGNTTSHITWSAQTWTEERATLNAFYTLLRGERFFGDDEKKRLLPWSRRARNGRLMSPTNSGSRSALRSRSSCALSAVAIRQLTAPSSRR